MRVEDAAETAPPPATTSLLLRIRRLVVVLVCLLLAAEVVEVVDAETVLWPQRAAAAVGIGWAAGLAAMVRLRDRWPRPTADVVAVGAVVMIGWGVGRVGGVLAYLLGIGILRTLFGSRAGVVRAVVALLAAYASVSLLLDGPASLLDLNLVVVGLGLGAFAWVMREVAEAAERHDVAAAWDAVLAGAAHRLLHVTSVAAIDDEVAGAVAELDRRGDHVELVPVPRAADLDPDVAVVDGDEHTVALQARLQRLATDARLARRLLASEDRYRRLAEGSRDGIYLRRAATVTAFPYANAAGRAMLGELDRPGAPGIDLGRVHPEDREGLVTAFKSGCVDEPIRFRLLDDDLVDGVRWLELLETPTTGGDGTVQGTVRDVSALRLQEEAMASALAREQQATERLRAVHEMRATFLAAISHELRTPMAGLVGAAHTLAAGDGRLSHEQASQLSGVVQRQADRVVRLLDDLLDVERLARGRMGVDAAPVPLLGLARSMVSGFGADAGRLRVDGEEVVLVVDRTHVERILHNLVHNSLKHAPSSSEVRVHVAPHPTGAVLVVEDDGPGVPAGLRDWVFEPLAHGPGSSVSPSPGAGIGLALVSRFAELHGGRAWVEEAESGGARFVVLLAGAPDSDEEAPAPGRTVLRGA